MESNGFRSVDADVFLATIRTALHIGIRRLIIRILSFANKLSSVFVWTGTLFAELSITASSGTSSIPGASEGL